MSQRQKRRKVTPKPKQKAAEEPRPLAIERVPESNDRKLDLAPCHASLDFGSNSYRLGIYAIDTDVFLMQEDKDVLDVGNRFRAGDHASHGYPLQTAKPVYQREKFDCDEIAIPQKYFMYAIVDVLRPSYLKQYPHIGPVLTQKDDPKFCKHLRDGLSQMLDRAVETIRKKAAVLDLTLRDMVLTVPAHWTLEFEDEYTRLMAAALGVPVETAEKMVFYYTETEALANYIFNDQICLWHLTRRQARPDVIVILDFGGHNSSVALYAVIRRANSNIPYFFLISDVESTGGGGEAWNFHVGEDSEQYLISEGYEVTPRAKQEMLDRFAVAKKRWPQAEKPVIQLQGIKDGTTGMVNIPPIIIDTAWEKAHKGPLDCASKTLKKLGKYECPYAVVAGGSAQSQTLRDRVQAAAEGARHPNIQTLFLHDLTESKDYTANVAKGAVIAHSKMRTVESYLTDPGVAYGLQRKESGSFGRRANQLWDDFATLIATPDTTAMVVDGQPRAWISVQHEAFYNGRDEVKLICSPAYGEAPSTDGQIYFKDCYDVLPSWPPKRGLWRIWMTVSGSGDSVELTVHRSYSKSVEEPRWVLKTPIKFPTYFEPGLNVAYVGERGKSLEDVMATRGGMDLAN